MWNMEHGKLGALARQVKGHGYVGHKEPAADRETELCGGLKIREHAETRVSPPGMIAQNVSSLNILMRANMPA